MAEKYVLDGNDFEVKRKNIFLDIIKVAVFVVVVSLGSAIIGYSLIALVYSTRTERGLKREIAQYNVGYDALYEKELALMAEIDALENVNDNIYNMIFHTPAPADRNLENLRYSVQNDTSRDENIIRQSALTLKKLSESAKVTEDNFRYIMRKITRPDFVMPPMHLPLANFSYARVGASTGQKYSPYYRVNFNHTGIDIFSEPGEPVLATADGVVLKVIRSQTGLGNTVILSHAGGYTTQYSHLSEIQVAEKQKVTCGQTIAMTGVSGHTLAPNLHYEVRHGKTVCDPVHYFYKNLNPKEYANCVIVSSSTEQSLD